MSLASISQHFTPPSQYITGYGCPLVYAPDRFVIAEVGPCDPPVPMTLHSGWGTVLCLPLVQARTIWGYEWRDSPTYLRLVNEKPEPAIIRIPHRNFIRQYTTLPGYEPTNEPIGIIDTNPGNPPF